MDIAVYGLIGYEGALALYEENRAFLVERFPAFWMESFLKRNEAPRCEEAFLKGQDQATYEGLFTRGQSLAVSIRKGGLYGALWKMCEVLGTGCEIDIQKVPIHQEVVEICECFDMDPYEITSRGAFLVAGENLARAAGENLARAAGENLQEKGIDGLTVIGHTTAIKDRVVLLGWDEKKNERHRRFLTPPQRQAKDLADSARKA